MLTGTHILRLAQIASWVAAALAILHWIGLSPSDVLTVSVIVTAIGIGVGLSVQGIVVSVLAGILIEAFDLVVVGEFIVIRAPYFPVISGVVSDTRTRVVVMRTDEGQASIPNGLFLSAIVTRQPKGHS